MEPLHPQIREALKQAHPRLTDDDIDRIEAMTMQRFEFDPEKEAARIQALDAERANLIQEKMPRYQEIVRAFSTARARPRPRRTPRVEIKPPDDDNDI